LVEERKFYYFNFHNGGKGQEEDCRILAEAEIGNERFGKYNILLTYDKDFKEKLQDKTETIQIMFPSELWKKLNIPIGSQPEKWFHHTNPNNNKTWWRW
jgi:hypothetical protein